jgi:hypothetical protein
VWSIDVTASSGNFILHEQYSGLLNDIALIRLVNSIPSHQYVSHIQLPSRSDVNLDLTGKSGQVSGFGRFEDVITSPSNRLRFMTQTIYANSKCEQVYGKQKVLDTNLCLSGSNGVSTCQGDSGKSFINYN